MKRERILITNDDGIDARGLSALIEVAQEFGDVTVVAPEVGMSGKSHSITMYEPLFVRHIDSPDATIAACSGTPVDCVKVAVDALMQEPPTLILSGINHGANSNMSVIYSGTMGAAREGSTYNIPSIGFSHISHNTDSDLTAATHYARTVIRYILEQESLPSHLCLNVNIPDTPLENIKGVKMCRQAMGHWVEDFEKRLDPRGKEYYWLTGSFINRDIDATDTDEWALANDYVSIVPIQLDITNFNTLESISSWDIK